jgi:hypothetical protein
MKRFPTLAGFTLLTGIFTGTAGADVYLKDMSEIAGSWQLETVAPSLKGARTEENRTWEFRTDGTIVTSGYNRHLKMNDEHQWKYQVINGKISADDPGRPGRTIDYSVYEKTGDSMTLKGGIEGFYFFKKR